jgi:uncharacterized protein (DUF885 family)
MSSPENDSEFAELARAYLDDRLARHPVEATRLGDHRFDARLADTSAEALADERRALAGFTARLAALRTSELSREHRVDAAIMADSIALRAFELDELREHTWNPLAANPGRAIYLLLARDFAPLPDRLADAAARLAAIPAALTRAREQLTGMPRVHLETAIGQFDGTIGLITGTLDNAIAASPPSDELTASVADVERARPDALAALTAHSEWLRASLAEAGAGTADPRIGQDRFARKLSLTLNAEADSAAILARAHADLDRVSEQITELAGSLGGTVREVLDRLAQDALEESSILAFCRDAFTAQADFVREHRLVTVYDDPVQVIEMPEIYRGVAVAYCDPPGPLEPAALPTFVAVSPAPADWPAARVASFYREYNQHMVHNLMVHEAMPGHFLQIAHASRFAGSATSLRAAISSGSFIEGWGVYSERLMADHSYPGDGDPRIIRMQQLKMQLRMIINAILDAGVHAGGMPEADAMALMTERGYQEEGEAAGKWRRVLLTSAQLSTYYVGYTEVCDLAADLTAARPGWSQQQVHDAMLAHGSPPAGLLRTLLL